MEIVVGLSVAEKRKHEEVDQDEKTGPDKTDEDKTDEDKPDENKTDSNDESAACWIVDSKENDAISDKPLEPDKQVDPGPSQPDDESHADEGIPEIKRAKTSDVSDDTGGAHENASDNIGEASDDAPENPEDLDDKEVNDYLDNTFDVRRSFITLEEPTIAMIRETYPPLFTGDQLVTEFRRVTDIHIDDVMRKYFATYAKGIIEISSGMSGSSAILRRAQLAKQDDTTLTQYWDMVSALCLIPLLVRETLDDMIHEVENNVQDIPTRGKVAPCLVCRGSLFTSEEFFLIAEEEIVQEFEEFTLAFAALLSTYWVFNMEYPHSMVNSYTYVQKGILQLKDNYPMPLPARQLINKIQRWKRCSQTE